MHLFRRASARRLQARHSAAAGHGEPPPFASALRPPWLRPAALAVILAAHAAVFVEFAPEPAPAPQLESLEVGLVPLGDAEQEQKPQQEIQPAEPPPPPPQAVAAAQPELTAPPPQTIAPDAPPLPVAKPRPVVEPDEDEPDPAELRRAERRQRERDQARREAVDRERRKAQEERQEAHRGAVQGAARANGRSIASFAGLVIAELNRRKFFPAAARQAGATGAVGVAFTIGPSGRVVRQSITRSSGNGALDGAARAILSAVHTPPPPGGSFSTATSIRFNLN